jgi:SulP family sulfate permease
VAAGLAAMIVIFVVNYSRVEVIRHAISGADMQSNVERPEEQQQTLRKFADQIYMLELQGFIFFGTANAFLDRVRARLAAQERMPVKFILLDFQRVSGLDSSAVFSFIKCKQITEEHGIQLGFTGVKENLFNKMTISELFTSGTEINHFPDLDRGLEWCENNLLEQHGISTIDLPASLYERLVSAGMPGEFAQNLIDYLPQQKLETGEYLVHQEEKADDMFLIESGKFSIYLELEDNEQVRLQTLGTRMVVGELGLYLDTTRTASIIADEPSLVYRLSRSKLELLKQNDPELAAALHEFIARQIAERLADTTSLLAAYTK